MAESGGSRRIGTLRRPGRWPLEDCSVHHRELDRDTYPLLDPRPCLARRRCFNVDWLEDRRGNPLLGLRAGRRRRRLAYAFLRSAFPSRPGTSATTRSSTFESLSVTTEARGLGARANRADRATVRDRLEELRRDLVGVTPLIADYPRAAEL